MLRYLLLVGLSSAHHFLPSDYNSFNPDLDHKTAFKTARGTLATSAAVTAVVGVPTGCGQTCTAAGVPATACTAAQVTAGQSVTCTTAPVAAEVAKTVTGTVRIYQNPFTGSNSRYRITLTNLGA